MTAITNDTQHVPGLEVGQVTFAAIGAAAVVAGARWIAGKAKDDAVERDELRRLIPTVADLKVTVAQCETHREHDRAEMARMSAEIECMRNPKP